MKQTEKSSTFLGLLYGQNESENGIGTRREVHKNIYASFVNYSSILNQVPDPSWRVVFPLALCYVVLSETP